MRILSLCSSYALGGLELYTYRSMEWFRERGHLELSVVRPSTPFDEWLRSNEFDYRNLDARATWPLKTAWSLSKIIDDKLIDAVHINWGEDLRLAVFAKRLSKQKPALVYSRHMRIPGSKRDPYHRWFYQKVDLVIVTTKEMHAQAIAHLPIDTERVHHLYLGVAQPRPVAPEECEHFWMDGELNRDRFSIGLFGRVEHTKGQHVLVDAMHRLVGSGCDVQAVIVGEAMNPTYYNNLKKQIIDHSLQDRVRLQGLIPDANRLMPCFDVVVLSSYCEHFGLVLIEAMHAGVTVIGTKAGGVPEIIDDGTTGLLCEPGNAIDLAAKIEQLYRNEEMKKTFALRGQERARLVFSEAQHFEALYNHFERTVNRLS